MNRKKWESMVMLADPPYIEDGRFTRKWFARQRLILMHSVISMKNLKRPNDLKRNINRYRSKL